MEKEDYQQLIDISLKLRIAESELAEALEELRRANGVMRKLLLKEWEK